MKLKLKLCMSMSEVEKIALRAAQTARLDEIKRVFYTKEKGVLPTDERLFEVAMAAYTSVFRDYHDLHEPAL